MGALLAKPQDAALLQALEQTQSAAAAGSARAEATPAHTIDGSGEDLNPLFQADMERRENHEAVGVQLVQQFFPEYTKGSGW